MIRGLVSVIIVNFNGLGHLKKCLPSLYGQSYGKIEVILVDNGSSDGSGQWVQENFSQVKIIQNHKNLGFAEANNRGHKVTRGEYVLFLNNDTKVTRSFLSNLLKIFEKDRLVGGAQSKIFFMDNPKQLDLVGSFLTNTGFLYHLGIYDYDSPRYSKQLEIYSAKGACMMFKREVLEKIKVQSEIFDSRYFAYFEETDMCHRVWLAGYKIVFVPTSIVYHKLGATSSKLKRTFIEYHSYKNRINSYIKNLGFKKLLVILPFHIFICEALSLFFVVKGRIGMFFAVQSAIFWNLINLRKTLEKRWIVQQRIRKVKDDIIFPRIYKRPKFKYYFGLLKGWNVSRVGKKLSA